MDAPLWPPGFRICQDDEEDDTMMTVKGSYRKLKFKVFFNFLRQKERCVDIYVETEVTERALIHGFESWPGNPKIIRTVRTYLEEVLRIVNYQKELCVQRELDLLHVS